MKSSFTLIELLIVLVLIGIVSSLAVPQYQLWVIRAQGAEAMKITQAIADAAWMYYIENGDFPETNLMDPTIPEELGIRIPESKYFNYGCHFYRSAVPGSPVNTCTYYAYHKDFNKLPIGAIFQYLIQYDDYPALGFQYQVNEKWYKTYSHRVKTGILSNEYEIIQGWP